MLSSSLEPTNEWYAIAKITGVKLIEALNKQFNRKYVSLMPQICTTSNDNFSLETSHVLPAMIRKFHESKINNDNFVNLWGLVTLEENFFTCRRFGTSCSTCS